MKQDKGGFIGHFNCVANEFENKEQCSSSDGLAIYLKQDDDNNDIYDGYCWACHQNFFPEEINKSSLCSELGIENGVVGERKYQPKPKAEPLQKQEVKKLYDEIGFYDKPYRKLKPEWMKYFGFLVKTDSNGVPIQVMYPESEDGKSISGMKIRILPKRFNKLGRTGINSMLGGQLKYKSPTKRLLVVAGENDGCAAWGMLKEYYDGRELSRLRKSNPNATVNDIDVNESVHVVWGTCGEGSIHKQLQAQYDFVDGYEEIIIGLDNDDAGKKATEQCLKVLPSEKVLLATWSMKDPHEMLERGKEGQFIRDFFNAKNATDTGIKTSNQIIDDMKSVLLAEKVTLPPYMSVIEGMMRRAFTRTGRVINIIGSTSCGKSTHVNNMTYHWMFSEGIKPLIISLEMTSGEYAIDLLSLHLKKNLDWFKDGMDAWDYIQREDVKKMYDDLFYDENFQERFCIVDDRDGSLESIKKLIEKAVKKYGCNLVVIDVLSDILRFLPIDEQEKFMAWQKNFAKGQVNMINVLHTRKLERDKDGKLRMATEMDALGSSSFVQSAHINIIINRDKMTDCDIERNTTYVDMPKCRRGTTGSAGKWYYDVETRQCYDFDTFFSGRKINPDYNPDDLKDENVVDLNTDLVNTSENDIVECDF